MCGIAGFIDSHTPITKAHSILETMLESIAHRGPDDVGQWSNPPVYLGHRRLSILDLSDKGHQPMSFKKTTLIFNGEIYNYVELRQVLEKKGYVFRTKTDTEVILVAYDYWGKSCVNKFIGMWAFALWDEDTQSLFCSRDRFGIKPFYYIAIQGKIYFGSEYRVLKYSSLFHKNLNIQQVYRWLQLGWLTYNNETFFTDINVLPPAHNLLFQNGHVSLEKYWEIDFRKKRKADSRVAEEFKEKFFRSIRMHMRSDVEIGGCLSGGLDSSAIASSVGTLYPDTSFKCFHIRYPGEDGIDESGWAKEVIRQYPSLDLYTHSPGGKELGEEFDRYLNGLEVPPAGSSPFSQYFVMKMASAQGMKVLLDGQGADEYLAGYLHIYYRLIAYYILKGKFTTAFKVFQNHILNQNFGRKQSLDLFTKSIISTIFGENGVTKLEYRFGNTFIPTENTFNLIDLPSIQTDRFHQYLYQLIFYTSLPTLLHYEDRNSMAFSIESRVPFLDHTLVEYIFSLPVESKMNTELGTKAILRQALNDVLPTAIQRRKDKKGFVTPGEITWLRGELAYLLESVAPNLKDFPLRNVEPLIENYLGGDNSDAKIVWRLAVLSRWMELQ